MTICLRYWKDVHASCVNLNWVTTHCNSRTERWSVDCNISPTFSKPSPSPSRRLIKQKDGLARHPIIWPKCYYLLEAIVKWDQLSSLNLDAITTITRSMENASFNQQFEQILPKMTALTELSIQGLSRCGDMSGVLAALPPQLEALNLSLSEIPIYPFCEVLPRMTALRKLDLTWCHLDDHKLFLLAPSPANCHALTSLYLDFLNLASGAAVGTLVRGLTQLQLLHLESCDLEDREVAELVRSLYDHHHLTSLNISDNILANETGRALADWPQLLCLKEVGLNKPFNVSEYTDTSVVEEALQKSLSFRHIMRAIMGGNTLLPTQCHSPQDTLVHL